MNRSHENRILPTLRTALELLVFVAGLVCTALPVCADEWDENYENGRAALVRGQWQTAIDFFQAALSRRPQPDAQAATSSLKLVEYLPYYYLGQAYLFSGRYRAAVKSFQESLDAGAVQNTVYLPALHKWLEIATKLANAETQQAAQPEVDPDFEAGLRKVSDLLGGGQIPEARQELEKLRRRSPSDPRLALLERWMRSEQQKAFAGVDENKSEGEARKHFLKGLDEFLTGRYENALAEFRAAQQLDPGFSAATSWIQKTRSEIARLRTAQSEETTSPATPEIIERTVTRTTAPVFAIRTPEDVVTTQRSGVLRLSGQVGDDQGVDHIEVTVNGRPLVDASGAVVFLRPENGDTTRFSFATRIPLQMGENQIVLTAFDVDSVLHRTIETLTVIRKPPLYRTAAAQVTGVSVLVVVLLGIFISRRVRYRLAIVNKYNPYIAGSPIRNEEMFFGREKLIRRILNTLHNNSLMIYGPRRIGKTSLQHQLKRRLETMEDPEFKFIPVLIDLQGTSEEHFFATLMEEILEACKPLLNGDVAFKLQENPRDYSGRDFSNDLRKVLRELAAGTEKKLKLVLLLDEVDELNKYSEQVNQRLRSVFMKTFAENLVAVMSGAYIRKNWESEGSPWYNFFEEVEVPPFERADAEALIQRPVAGIFSYTQEAVERIIEYSGCKPYLIQRLCINVINRIIEAKRRRVTVADVEAVADRVLTAVEAGER